MRQRPNVAPPAGDGTGIQVPLSNVVRVDTVITMAIKPELLSFKSVGELLAPTGPQLRIPDFQRPYSWTPQNARQLVTDVENAMTTQPDLPYVMGTIILLSRPGHDHFEVVDGQQRLLTLHMLRTLLRRDRIPELEHGKAAIHQVYQELDQRVCGLSDAHEYRQFLDSHAQVLQIVTDDEDEAFQFFDSQNYRGKELRPHDLLKAFHLREMSASTAAEKRAVVEEWEAAEENDLDRLFGTYLARIHRWSRNLHARDFTAGDIDIFKGVGRSTPRLPGTEYHRAAKLMLPGVQEWSRTDAEERNIRDERRSQHQLDTPIVAGRSFFDFTAFMLAESKRLEIALFRHDADLDADEPDDDLEIFKDRPRFRFTRELCVAAGLYYLNKYSEADFDSARKYLFRWAYSLRLTYDRLGWPSTDNYALGDPRKHTQLAKINLFATMRDNLDPRALALEQVPVPDKVESKNEDDKRLHTLLQEGH